MIAEINVSATSWIIAMSAFTTLLLTAIGILVHIVQRWTRTEDKLAMIADKVAELVKEKDEVHKQIVLQIERISDRLWKMHCIQQKRDQ